METVLFTTDLGECGIDTTGSPGVGQFFVRLFDGSYDALGFDTLEEAQEELAVLTE